MLLFALLSTFSSFQDWQLDHLSRWEHQASLWMTQAESDIYESLEPSDQEKFKGFFVARRIKHPEKWPETGLQLPHFFVPEKFGDIRDALSFALGSPKEISASPHHQGTPAAWVYQDKRFDFKPLGKNKVQLAASSLPAWEHVKKDQILHPNLRYDFRTLTIGRNRLPAELKWQKTSLSGSWRIPRDNATHWRVELEIPQAFLEQFKPKTMGKMQSAIGKQQTMELLVFLKTQNDQPLDQVEPFYIRHDSKRVDFSSTKTLIFETILPPGRYHAELLAYSGFLPWGLRTQTTITTLPSDIPRIGDPIVCPTWQPAELQVTNTDDILAGNILYKTTPTNTQAPTRVLVATSIPDTQLKLHRGNSVPVNLKKLSQDDTWAVFESPQLTPTDSLIALGFTPKSPLVAMSSFGPRPGSKTSAPPVFQQNGSQNYLQLESLDFAPTAELHHLFVNNEAFLASKTGSFPWPALNWDRTAKLRLEYFAENQWQFADFTVSRRNLFQEIQVRPKFLVAGFRDLQGKPSQVPFSVEVEGIPIPPRKTTAFTQVPKLWGIVVSDPLLRSQAWTEIRDSISQWLRENTGENDYIYIVHIATRPQLVLEPTPFKTTVLATLKSLHSKVELENYFTVRYLFQGLTQLPQHQTMPHQVLLLTHQLTEEVSQMETLLPLLRDTGLQLYNLEFPFEFQAESSERIASAKEDPLEGMKAREEDEQRRYGTLRDNIQESRNVKAGWSFVFRTKGQKRDAKEEAIRREAFQRAFNQQLASLTAGMALQSGAGETNQSLFQFLESLSNWQKNLVHISLPLPIVSSEMIQVKPKQGHVASWTLVEWTPQGKP